MTVMESAGMGAGPQPIPRSRAPLIIVVGADKGGVGKTTVARALMDYVGRHGIVVRAFDTEPGEVGVLKRFFPGAEMLNAGTVSGQMRVVDSARDDAVTLVDARAGLLTPMLQSFARIDLFSDVRAGAVRLLVLHVVGSSVASESEIAPVIEAMKGANLIRVNNMANPDARIAPAAPGEVSITIPYLDETAYEAVDRSDQGFVEFAGDPRRSRVLRGEVRAWLAAAHAQFDRAGLGAMIKPE